MGDNDNVMASVSEFSVQDHHKFARAAQSYGKVSLIAHKEKGIYHTNFLHNGHDMPSRIHKYNEQHGKQTSMAIGAAVTTSTNPLSVSGGLGVTKSTTHFRETIDEKAAPKWIVEHQFSGQPPESDNQNMSSKAYDLTYGPHYPQDREHSNLKVAFGMSIGIDNKDEDVPPRVSFAFQNQTILWITGPSPDTPSYALIIAISTHVDDIETHTPILINESISIRAHDKASPSSDTPTIKKSGHALFVSTYIHRPKEPPSSPGKKVKDIMNRIKHPGKPQADSNKKEILQLNNLPQRVHVSRGWHFQNNRWRDVIWPMLDGNLRPAEGSPRSAEKSHKRPLRDCSSKPLKYQDEKTTADLDNISEISHKGKKRRLF